MLPEVGGMNPVTMRMVVDLPAPFGPRKPRTSPRSTPKERSFTATFAPNAFVRFSTLITAFLLGSHTRFFHATSIKTPRRLQRGGIAARRWSSHRDGFRGGRHQARDRFGAAREAGADSLTR